ncbi:MAG: BMP family ABC transporter substrate-binding protein [Acidimicrobiales bacterium]
MSGPVEVGDAKLYVDGFKAGAEATADVSVNVNYIESFSDTALAAEAATAFVGAGADVLTGSAQMTAGAIGVAGNEGVLWFGTQSAQTQLAPEVVVANQVYHWEGILTDLIGQIKGGTLGGQTYDLTLENGGLVVEFNDAYAVPDDVKAAADAAIAGISDGSMSTGVGS